MSNPVNLHNYTCSYVMSYVYTIYKNIDKIDNLTTFKQLLINKYHLTDLRFTMPPLVPIDGINYFDLLNPEIYKQDIVQYTNNMLDYLDKVLDIFSDNLIYDVRIELSNISKYLSSLTEYLLGDSAPDLDINYHHAPIEVNTNEKDKFESTLKSKLKILLLNDYVTYQNIDSVNYYKPSRINSALYPLDYSLANVYYRVICNHGNIFEGLEYDVHYDHYLNVYKHSVNFLELSLNLGLRIRTVNYKMEELERLLNPDKFNNCTYNLEILDKLVKKLIKIDLRTIDNYTNIDERLNTPYNFSQIKVSNLYHMVLKLRQTLHNPEYIINDIKSITVTDDFIYVTKTGYQIVKSTLYDCLYFNGNGFTTIVKMSTNECYFMDNVHFDFIISAIEIKLNLNIIIYMNEHDNINNVLHLLDQLTAHNNKYDNKVAFMKTFETLCLMKADLINSPYINWKPIINVIQSLCFLNPLETFTTYVFGCRVNNHDSDDIYISILNELNYIKPTDLINLSTTHKLLYYSEVCEMGGLEKYLSRTHTPRKFDSIYLMHSKFMFRKLFIKNYYHKFNKLPLMKGKEDIIRQITNAIVCHNTNPNLYDDIDIKVFEDIKFIKNFELELDNNPILYSKDKASSPKSIKFYADSTSELIDVISTFDYKMSNDLSNLNDNSTAVIREIYELDTPVSYKFPTKLCMKEREQKKEGRLFGCATTEHKHELSYLNKSIETVLSLFGNQFIAINNSDKKRLMHENAQLLINPLHYSLMLDIEGHNQSIQPENMIIFLEEFRDLFDNNVFLSLANYFTNLDVYYNYHFKGKSLYSKGQRGGIEGWMNHLWTLMTLIYSELLHELNVIDKVSLMVYSDDVNIIFKHSEMTVSNINKLYKEIQSHYLKFGFNIKPSQTIISKNRSTLLRTHYYRGEICEPSLKKILSVSSFTENLLVNEAIDINSVNSSINSALEYSNYILTHLYIKWHKFINLSIRTFLHFLFVTDRNRNNMTRLIGPKFRILFYTYTSSSDLNITTEDMENNLPYLYKLFNCNDFNSLINAMNKVNKLDRLFKDNYHLILDALLEDDFLLMVYYCRIMLPEDIGGYNASSISSSILTGISNNKLRTIDEILFILNNDKNLLEDKHKKYIRNMIYKHFVEIGEKDETSLFNSEFPQLHEFESTDSFIRKNIKTRIVKKIKNIDILKYMNMDKYINEYKINAINLCRENLNIRLLSYYYENSVFSVMDTIYNRIENSRSFIKKLKFNSKFFQILYEKNTASLRNLFKYSEDIDSLTYNSITSCTITEYLVEYRQRLFPKIKFLPINEPTYHNLLKSTLNSGDSIFVAHLSKRYLLREGFKVYKHLEVPTGISIKYLEEDKSKETTSMIARKIINCVYVTKWIIGNDASLCNNNVKMIIKDNNYIKLCNYTISFFCNDIDFMLYYEKIHLPTGGELMHRLNNCKFKNRSFIKSLHDYVLLYAISDDNFTLFRGIYLDSNINYNYCTNLIKLKLAMKHYIDGVPSHYTCFKLDIDNTIVKDVRVRFSYSTLLGDLKAPEVIMIEGVSASKIFLENDYVNYGNIYLKTMKLKRRDFETDIVAFYKEIKHSYLWINFSLSGDTLWLLFRKQFDLIYPSFLHLTDEEFKSMAKRSIKAYYNEQRNNITLLNNELKEEIYASLIDHNVDDNYKKLTESISRLIRLGHFYYVNRNDSLEELNKSILLELNKSETYKEKYLMNLLYKFIIDNCLALYVNRYNKLEIDINLTLNILKSYICDKSCELLEFEIYNLLTLLNYEYIESKFTKYSILITAKLNYINRFLMSDDIRLRNENIKYTPVIDINLIPKYLKHKINYQFVKLDTKTLNILKGSKAILNETRSNAVLKSHPDSFFSLTGSDSIGAGIGIANYIIKNHDYNKLSYCDLTAGRGDFHLSFKHMGIKCDSYNRKDFYTKTFKIDSIINAEYDVLKFETLDFTLKYDVIIIDISFIKGDQQGLMDTIDNYVNLGKKIILRINSLNLTILGNHLINRSSDYSVNLLYPTGNSYKPYQLYLEIFKGQTIENRDKTLTEAMRKFILYYKHSLEMSADTYGKSDENSYNSINSLFNIDTLDYKVIMKEYKDFLDSNFILMNLEKSLNNLLVSDMVPVLLNQISLLKNKDMIYDTNNDDHYNKILHEFLNTLPLKVKNKIYEQISTRKIQIYITNVNNIKFNKYETFVKTSCFSNLQEKLLPFKNLNKINLITDESDININKINELLSKESNESYDVRLNVKYYATIIVLLYMRLTDSYDEVLSHLLLIYSNVHYKNKKVRLYNLIKDVKMSSNLLIKLDKIIKDLSFNDIDELITIGRSFLTDISEKNKHYFGFDKNKDKENEKNRIAVALEQAMAENTESIMASDDNFINEFIKAMSSQNNILSSQNKKADAFTIGEEIDIAPIISNSFMNFGINPVEEIDEEEEMRLAMEDYYDCEEEYDEDY